MTAPRLDRRRLLTLLGAWAIAVLLPGIFAIPWAGRGVEEFQIPAYILWGLGFFVQFGLFNTVAKMTGATDLAPWLVASIAPWLVNLTVPDNPIYIPVLVLGVGFFAAWIYLRSAAADQLLHEGVVGTGTVIEVVEPRAFLKAVNNGYVRRSIRLTVERPDKHKTYEAEFRDLYKVDELPKRGDKIALRVDPEDAKRVMADPAVDASRGKGDPPD